MVLKELNFNSFPLEVVVVLKELNFNQFLLSGRVW